jgi:uncharacterized protein with NAD-binding domain and iron-sulfur cluster
MSLAGQAAVRETIMPQVTIVGAGIAGLAAALRLTERGFDVTLLEQDDFLGGKLGAHTHEGHHRADFHEHSYHMYLNWYRNFWQIVKDVRILHHFMPEPGLAHLRPAGGNQPANLIDVGTVRTFWHNILSGVEPPLEMFLYAYSLVDLLGTPLPHRHRSDSSSVFAFTNSRPYGNRRSMFLHSETLAMAFSCPTYLASLNSYRNFIRYGVRHPDPMMWLLKGNTQQCLFEPLEKHMHEVADEHRGQGARLRIRRLTHLKKVHLSGDAITALEVDDLTESPTVIVSGHLREARRTSRVEPITGDVILAIPPKALARLVDLDILKVAPSLGNVSKLRSEPMASLNVYFKRKLPNVPKEIAILLGSKYRLSFLDNSQCWQLGTPMATTFLNVIVSDFASLARGGQADDYAAIKEMIYDELSRYLEFNYEPASKNDDIDRDRSHLQTNVGETLFTNDVGTWEFRPETTCGIRNLFIAGDYCKTFVDVVSIEGAVVSGLMAAEAVRQRGDIGGPIAILKPETYPDVAWTALKVIGAPYAYAAKALSMASDVLKLGYDEMFPNGGSTNGE